MLGEFFMQFFSGRDESQSVENVHNVRCTRVVEFNVPSSSLSHYVLLPIIRSRTQLFLYLDVNSMKSFFSNTFFHLQMYMPF